MKWSRILFAVWALLGGVALARGSLPLPDPVLTPGAINPVVTEASIGQTICRRGWTATVRPPVSYTEPLKKAQIRRYGYRDRRPWHYEEDHLIPLDLGGAPASPANLWPEPHLGPGEWGSYAKDRLEARLVRLVCWHRLGLNKARRMIARDWIVAYRRFIGPKPDNAPLGQRGDGDGRYHGYGDRSYDHWHHYGDRSYERWHHDW